ncbi:ribosome silencing factor [Salisediminibacterium beveridgei]|uniref:Ribosomal silencing factor RsfS n=1 Tax=Salisediminibacterium beveridgei TaxID=632773 RepID=A0A1D7QU97_9BACI|nr:ribosome silencing factor [Salisediminibacterium beveridgei]AOM82567.1 hypothetical protein BBEV_1199 [Salisediminibacterium beveridgei]
MTTEDLLALAVKAIDDKNGQQIVTMDMKGVSLVADYFVITHGNSETQVEAIAREVKKKAQEYGLDVKRLEGLNDARWVLIDLKYVVIHVFHKEERLYYNLEKLWSDARTIPSEDILNMHS